MPPRLPAPFGVPWDRLDLADVQRFLALGEDESLTWEAKGDEIRRDQVRKAASAFGNSVLGGILVLGASQDRQTREWTVNGWRPPEAEVGLWVNNALDDGGVTPKPSVEVKGWPLDDGRVLTCVGIWPAAVPPVVTSAGQVWERTSGKSVLVTDPGTLRRLFERGETARTRALQLSNDGAGELFAAEQTRGNVCFVLSLAAPSLPSELAAEVFRQSRLGALAETVKSLHRKWLAHNLQQFVKYGGDWNQGGVTFWTDDNFGHSESYSIRVGRDGRVTLAFRDPDIGPTSHPENFTERLRAMWDSGKAVLVNLGAVGEIHARVKVVTIKGVLDAASWSDLTSDGRGEIDAMIRDIKRGLGAAAWEPELPTP